ncbi:hypothetical protein ADUPG1_000543 [Aduncisulcus paluster]|uniref:Uncharacterized protein n=1 Tax=Aduncisulcus paluster TaxID=2918883 RepID=A0ABQ5K6R4_9EUKA|nr:hypothetical protein ADUPG1_000543 [Aduncisulcus paluster]
MTLCKIKEFQANTIENSMVAQCRALIDSSHTSIDTTLPLMEDDFGAGADEPLTLTSVTSTTRTRSNISACTHISRELRYFEKVRLVQEAIRGLSCSRDPKRHLFHP